MNVIVADSPNDGPFLQFENNNLGVWPVRRIFDTQLHIFKKLRVPEGLEVAAQSLFVVWVIVAAENPSFQCVVADAPVPDKINAFDDCWLLGLLLSFLRTGSEFPVMFVCNDFAGEKIQGGVNDEGRNRAGSWRRRFIVRRRRYSRTGQVFRSERTGIRKTRQYRGKTQTQDRKNPKRRTDSSDRK